MFQFNQQKGTEWLGDKEDCRDVTLIFDANTKKIQVMDDTLQLVRTIDLSREQNFALCHTTQLHLAVLKLPREYDLVILLYNEPEFYSPVPHSY